MGRMLQPLRVTGWLLHCTSETHTMARHFPLIWVVIFLLVCWGALLHASEEKPVCYKHKLTGAMMYACKEIKGPNDAFPRVHCVDTADNQRKPFTPSTAWEKLAADHPDCQPRRALGDVPRGQEGDKP